MAEYVNRWHELLVTTMDRNGWTHHDVVARGRGRPSYGSVQRYYRGVTLREPLRRRTIEAFARALDLDVETVQEAVLASVQDWPLTELSPESRKVVAELERLPSAARKRLCRLLLSEAGKYRTLRSVS